MARALDHFVLASQDLTALHAVFVKLGFFIGARNQHPWGTENHIVQFGDSFLELIGVGDASKITPNRPARRDQKAQFSFGSCIKKAIARRDGMAMLCLRSENSAADLAAFSAAKIGDYQPFDFERSSVAPDGTRKRVAFTLTFAQNKAAPKLGFFTCQQHAPQNFWDKAKQNHDNGASGVKAVIMVSKDPSDHHEFLDGFLGNREMRATSFGLEIKASNGTLDVLSPEAFAFLYGDKSALKGFKSPRFCGLHFAVRSVSALEKRLIAAHIPYTNKSNQLIVPASFAGGTTLIFSE